MHTLQALKYSTGYEQIRLHFTGKLIFLVEELGDAKMGYQAGLMRLHPVWSRFIINEGLGNMYDRYMGIWTQEQVHLQQQRKEHVHSSY